MTTRSASTSGSTPPLVGLATDGTTGRLVAISEEASGVTTGGGREAGAADACSAEVPGVGDVAGAGGELGAGVGDAGMAVFAGAAVGDVEGRVVGRVVGRGVGVGVAATILVKVATRLFAAWTVNEHVAPCPPHGPLFQ